MILAIDPGNELSAWCVVEQGALIASKKQPNAEVLSMLRGAPEGWQFGAGSTLAVEMIASYGMPVGREVFETCLWIGRFIEAWGGSYRLVYRLECKLHLCKDSRAKDANLRRALLDRFGEKGTKADPGQLYGFKSHLFAALAVALTAAETPGEWRDG